ncbi:MAG: hypothetical protein II272_00830 [Oscillospiraceae bacterium]|nr:hypothetical protein [Oscillospiraceae bacterium]
MKREYRKPFIAFEAFQLSAALAGDCDLKLNHYSYQCTANENGVGLGPNTTGIFYDYYNCQLDLTGPEVDGADTVCYHGPMYTIGQVFMAS